jgi:hypothetical protein
MPCMMHEHGVSNVDIVDTSKDQRGEILKEASKHNMGIF